MDNTENVIILSPDDFQNICRTCLSQVQLESIFSDDQNFSIVNMLMEIANVQISDADNLPPKICTSCIKSLNLAFRFKQQCEEAEYKLKEFLNAYKIINGCDYLENVDAISTETEEQKISNYSNFDKFDTGDLAPTQFTDTDVIVESFVGIIFDKEEKDENLCTETIVKCENIEKTHQTEEQLNENLKGQQIEFIECTVCKKLINAKHLKNHMKDAHSTEKCFQCKNCNKKFSFRSNFLRHLKLHAGDHKEEKKQMFKPCPTCGKLINSRRLNNHIKLHSAEKFLCEICNYKFSIRSNYVRHLKIHNGEKPYVCETCGKGFIQSYSLREHIRVHTRERPYKCKLCDRAFTQATQLNKHQKEMHNLEIPAENNKQFTCNTCKEIFTSSLALNAHSRVHLNKPFHCDKCNKLFTNKKNLDEHNCTNQSINGVKQVDFGVFICDECGKQFSNKPLLIAHRYLHHSSESHLCSFCGKNCVSSIQLKRHLIIHSEERPFKCDHCDKTFKTKLTLKVHRLQHTGERPFSCKECDKTFHQAAHLRAHRRVHTGEKPYNCIICNKNFACKINYIVHMRIHSGETPYICPICNKGFHHSTAKKKHLRTHKNQNEVSVAS